MKSIISAIAVALPVLLIGCTTRVVYTPAPPPPPAVVQSAPPPGSPPPVPSEAPPASAAAPEAVPATPPPAVPAGYAPDYYVWDGYEYVGVYGDQYVYWTGGAWVVCSPVIDARFHGWEHYHPDWRRGAWHYYRGRPHYR